MFKVITTVTITVVFISAIAFAAVKQVSFINQSKCAHCGTCQKTCPMKAISKVQDGKAFKFVVDPKKCIGCGACVKACPTKSISLVDPSSIQALPASTTTNTKNSVTVSEKTKSGETPQSQESKK